MTDALAIALAIVLAAFIVAAPLRSIAWQMTKSEDRERARDAREQLERDKIANARAEAAREEVRKSLRTLG